MCTYNISLSDALVSQARRHFSDDQALQEWLQSEVMFMLERIVNGEDNQQAMVKESMTRAFEELHSGKAMSDARGLFA